MAASVQSRVFKAKFWDSGIKGKYKCCSPIKPFTNQTGKEFMTKEDKQRACKLTQTPETFNPLILYLI